NLDIHTKNDSALRYACYGGHTDVVKILLENGADYNVDNYYPFIIAVSKGYIGIVDVLLGYNYELLFVNEHSPICLACAKNKFEMVEHLIKQGEDIYV